MALAAVTGTYLENTTTPLSAYPFTIGGWFRADINAGAGGFPLWAVGGDVFSTDGVTLSVGGGTLDMSLFNGGSTTADCFVGSIYSGWFFVLARHGSATVHSLDVITPTDGLLSGTDATSATFAPTSGTLLVGNRLFCKPLLNSINQGAGLDAACAEFWITNSDVFPSGLTTNPALVRQLAYGGPFSVPHVAAKLTEYQSFRFNKPSLRAPDAYFGGQPRTPWAITGTPTMAAHPPLPYWFKRPTEDIAAIAMI